MATNPRNSNGNARRKLKLRMRHEASPCHLCGYPIMYGKKYPHKQSFVVDELQTVKDKGSTTSRSNCFPAHQCCNAWRGCRDVTPRLRAEIKRRYETEVLHLGRARTCQTDDGFY